MKNRRRSVIGALLLAMALAWMGRWALSSGTATKLSSAQSAESSDDLDEEPGRNWVSDVSESTEASDRIKKVIGSGFEEEIFQKMLQAEQAVPGSTPTKSPVIHIGKGMTSAPQLKFTGSSLITSPAPGLLQLPLKMLVYSRIVPSRPAKNYIGVVKDNDRYEIVTSDHQRYVPELVMVDYAAHPPVVRAYHFWVTDQDDVGYIVNPILSSDRHTVVFMYGGQTDYGFTMTSCYFLYKFDLVDHTVSPIAPNTRVGASNLAPSGNYLSFFTEKDETMVADLHTGRTSLIAHGVLWLPYWDNKDRLFFNQLQFGLYHGKRVQHPDLFVYSARTEKRTFVLRNAICRGVSADGDFVLIDRTPPEQSYNEDALSNGSLYLKNVRSGRPVLMKLTHPAVLRDALLDTGITDQCLLFLENKARSTVYRLYQWNPQHPAKARTVDLGPLTNKYAAQFFSFGTTTGDLLFCCTVMSRHENRFTQDQERIFELKQFELKRHTWSGGVALQKVMGLSGLPIGTGQAHSVCY